MYYSTQKQAKNAANKAVKENLNTHYETTDFNCNCGQSLAYKLIDLKTLNTLEYFVVCKSCKNNN